MSEKYKYIAVAQEGKEPHIICVYEIHNDIIYINMKDKDFPEDLITAFIQYNEKRGFKYYSFLNLNADG